jgi:two-component system, LytTR family, response regulator
VLKKCIFDNKVLAMKTLNCIIIDDEEIDRLMVTSFVKRYSFLNLVGVFENAAIAKLAIENQSIDIAFLDIDMPNVNGLEFRKQTAQIPVCVFITAHPEHAVESFELEALDFIVKPLKLERFDKTMQRIVEFMEVKHKAQLFELSIGGDIIYIKEGHERTKVKLHEILYLEALKDYTLVVTEQKRHCVLSTIGNLLKEAHFQSFVRVHRSYAIQKQFVKKINTSDLQLNNNTIIPLGRSFKDNLNFVL